MSRVSGLLLRFFPAGFRGRCGAEVVDLIGQQAADVRRREGWVGAAARGGSPQHSRRMPDTPSGRCGAPRCSQPWRSSHWPWKSAPRRRFTVIDGVLLTSLPYDDPDELVAVYLQIPSVSQSPIGHTSSTFLTFRDRNTVFDSLRQ